MTFDYVDDDGLVRVGEIRPATRTTLRRWLGEHCPVGDVEFALEGCTGWRYVVEEMAAAGVVAHLGDPAEIGDARRFTSSDQLVRFAGLDVTVYFSDDKRSPGHLSRQGSPELRWAAFEAAKSAARRGSPDCVYYRRLAAKRAATTARTRPWAGERKVLRRCYHTLGELGDAALALPDT